MWHELKIGQFELDSLVQPIKYIEYLVVLQPAGPVGNSYADFADAVVALDSESVPAAFVAYDWLVVLDRCNRLDSLADHCNIHDALQEKTFEMMLK